MRLSAVSAFAFCVLVVACQHDPPPVSSGPAPSGSSSNGPAAYADPSACVDAVAAHQKAVQARLDDARVKMSARDGAGCLADLDAYDKLDPWTGAPTTDPKSAFALMRGQCMMLAGQCSPGKDLYRAALANNSGATFGPEMMDKSVDAVASMYCQGSALAPRDELLRALMDINTGAYMTKKTPAECKAAYDTAKRLASTVPPKDADDTMVKQANDILRVAGPTCFAHAGDCQDAWTTFHAEWQQLPNMSEPILKQTFPNVARGCSAP